MYNEIYKGIIKLFNQDEDERENKGRIPHFLSITYGFDPLQIVNVVNIKFQSSIPDIVLVLANAPNNDFKTKYSDTIVIDGEIKKLVLFNLDSYMSDDVIIKITNLTWSIWETVLHLSEYTKQYLDPQFMRCVNLTNIMYYAPLILSVKLLDRLMKPHDVQDNMIAAALSNFYKTMVYPTTIQSVRKLLSDATIIDVLDNSLWLSVTNDVYPYIRFDEVDDVYPVRVDEVEDEEDGEDI